MKKIIDTIRKYGFISLFAMVAVTVALMQSCNTDGDKMLVDSSMQYLNITDMGSSVGDLVILQEAQKRLDPYVKIKNGKYVMTVSSGDQLRMSERVFNMMMEALKITNSKIDKGELYILNGELLCTELSFESFPLTRGDGDGESDPSKPKTVTTNYWWGSKSTTNYSGDYAWNYYKTTSDVSNNIGVVLAAMAYGANKLPGIYGVVVGEGLTIFAGLDAVEAANLCNALYTAARSGGVTIVTMTRPDGYGGLTNTFIYDSNGNLIRSC